MAEPERLTYVGSLLLLAFSLADATWNVFQYAAASDLMFTGVALLVMPDFVAWIDRRLR